MIMSIAGTPALIVLATLFSMALSNNGASGAYGTENQ